MGKNSGRFERKQTLLGRLPSHISWTCFRAIHVQNATYDILKEYQTLLNVSELWKGGWLKKSFFRKLAFRWGTFFNIDRRILTPSRQHILHWTTSCPLGTIRIIIYLLQCFHCYKKLFRFAFPNGHNIINALMQPQPSNSKSGQEKEKQELNLQCTIYII